MSNVAIIIGGGPGISASCARLFRQHEMAVAVAARNIEKAVLQTLAKQHDVKLIACDATDFDAVSRLFQTVSETMGNPNLVVHNIDGRTPEIFRQGIAEVNHELVMQTLSNAAYSAFLVAQQAARYLLNNELTEYGRGSLIFTNASAAIKGYPKSGAFAAACHAKAGLAQSVARELMPEGIHVANVPIDAAIGWRQEDGTRQHRLAGTSIDDNMADPDCIAETYLQIHRQHRSTWTHEVVLRPWVENW